MNTTVMERPQTVQKRDWISTVRGKVNQKIVDHILNHPDQSPKEAAEALGCKPNTILWYRHYINRTLNVHLPYPKRAGAEKPKVEKPKVENVRQSSEPELTTRGTPRKRRSQAAVYEYVRENPDESPALTAKRFGVSPGTVYTVRARLRKEGLDIRHGGNFRTQVNEAALEKAAQEGPVMEEKEKPSMAETPAPDMVNFPPHYTDGGVDTIDYIRAKLTDEEFAGYCKGNALKYVSRAGKKSNPGEDLAKARWYLDRLLAVRV